MKKHILKNRRRLIISVIIVYMGSMNLYAQYTDHRNRKVDSLEQVLQTNPPTEASELLRLYARLMWGYKQSNVEKSMEYARKGVAISEKIDDPYILCDCYFMLGVGYYTTSRYDSALYHFDRALAVNETMKGDKRYTEAKIDDNYSSIYGTIGNLYNIQGDYHRAVEYYTKALRIFEKYGWKESMFITYNNIGELYVSMENYKQAEIIHKKQEALAYEIKDSMMIAMAEIALGGLYANHHNDYAKAQKCADIAYAYFFSHPEEGEWKVRSLTLLGDIQLGQNNLPAAEPYIREALQLADTLGIPHEKATALGQLSLLHLLRKEWKQAEQTALEALATDDSEPANTLTLYRQLAEAYAYLHQPDKAKEYFDKANDLQSSYSNRNYQSALSEQEVRYETEKKDIKITALTREKRLYVWLTVTGGSIALLILLLLFYRNRLHRRQKQLLATQVALESETAERQRLAKDLHDGLGGMLSLVRIKMKDRLYDYALDALDKSVDELRRVAHHIMPESLIEHGLKTSLQDFALSVPGAEFHFFGKEIRLDTGLEVVLYRCAYELVNNSLRHAAASHIAIQLVQEPESVTLSVTDDGEGFDAEQQTEGMGLKNIRNRISVYNGRMLVLSDNESGTEINIEIPLKKTGGKND